MKKSYIRNDKFFDINNKFEDKVNPILPPVVNFTAEMFEDGVISRNHNVKAYKALEDFCYPYYGVRFDTGSYDQKSGTLFIRLYGPQATGYDQVALRIKEAFGVRRLVLDGISV